MDLYHRLKHLKTQQKKTGKGQSSESPRAAVVPGAAVLPGAAGASDSAWQQVGQTLWRRTRNYELDTPSQPLNQVLMRGRCSSWSELSFIDTETTGLSSGAGTIAFLTGAGRFTREGFTLTQMFVGDFPGEADYLRQVRDLLSGSGTAFTPSEPAAGPPPCLISYNGASFDLPLLRSRMIMQGLGTLENQHLDILYPTRRLYSRSLPDCRLGTVEDRVLGISRDLDIPGSQIPDVYFNFQREDAGAAPDSDSLMKHVIEHHASDIHSLAKLLIHLNTIHQQAEAKQPAIFAGFGSGIPGMVSPRGLARQFIDSGSPDVAREYLQKSANSAHVRGEDLMTLAALLRRDRQFDQAHEYWLRAFQEFGEHAALIPVLVHLEHRRKDYSLALKTAVSASEQALSPRIRKDLEARIPRIRLKFQTSGV